MHHPNMSPEFKPNFHSTGITDITDLLDEDPLFDPDLCIGDGILTIDPEQNDPSFKSNGKNRKQKKGERDWKI